MAAINPIIDWWKSFGHDSKRRDRFLNFSIYFSSVMFAIALVFFDHDSEIPPLGQYGIIPWALLNHIIFGPPPPIKSNILTNLSCIILALYFVLLLYALLAKDKAKLFLYFFLSLLLMTVRLNYSVSGYELSRAFNSFDDFVSAPLSAILSLNLTFGLYPFVVVFLLSYVYHSDTMSLSLKAVKIIILLLAFLPVIGSIIYFIDNGRFFL